jgi:hypothetical protein
MDCPPVSVLFSFVWPPPAKRLEGFFFSRRVSIYLFLEVGTADAAASWRPPFSRAFQKEGVREWRGPGHGRGSWRRYCSARPAPGRRRRAREDFGGAGDGRTLNTAAFARAVASIDRRRAREGRRCTCRPGSGSRGPSTSPRA